MHSCTLLGRFEDADLHEAGDGEVLWIGAEASLLHVLDEGPNPTLIMVANSSCLELKSREVGASGFRKGRSGGPGCNSQQVDGCCGYDVL